MNEYLEERRKENSGLSPCSVCFWKISHCLLTFAWSYRYSILTFWKFPQNDLFLETVCKLHNCFYLLHLCLYVSTFLICVWKLSYTICYELPVEHFSALLSGGIHVVQFACFPKGFGYELCWFFYLVFLFSFASLEDGITHFTANLQRTLLLFSRTWRETTDIVHASHSMKNACQQSPRQKWLSQQARMQWEMGVSRILRCQTSDSLMVYQGSLLIQKRMQWRCLLQSAWSLFQEQAILMSWRYIYYT